MKYTIPVITQHFTLLEIEADSLEDALEESIRDSNFVLVEDYISDSCEIDHDGITLYNDEKVNAEWMRLQLYSHSQRDY